MVQNTHQIIRSLSPVTRMQLDTYIHGRRLKVTARPLLTTKAFQASGFVNVSRETHRMSCEFMASCSPLSRNRALWERWNDLWWAPKSYHILSAFEEVHAYKRSHKQRTRCASAYVTFCLDTEAHLRDVYTSTYIWFDGSPLYWL